MLSQALTSSRLPVSVFYVLAFCAVLISLFTCSEGLACLSLKEAFNKALRDDSAPDISPAGYS